MFGRKSAERGIPKHEEIDLHKVMEQVEKVLRQMQTEGKDLTRVRIKRFQKTHHVSCRCQQCKSAEEKKDPRLRGLLEDGFKVYLDKTRE